jgi:hypothetical protein
LVVIGTFFNLPTHRVKFSNAWGEQTLNFTFEWFLNLIWRGTKREGAGEKLLFDQHREKELKSNYGKNSTLRSFSLSPLALIEFDKRYRFVIFRACHYFPSALLRFL